MKKYNYKEFFNGECFLLINSSNEEHTLNILSKTNLKWSNGTEIKNFNPPKQDGYAVLTVCYGALMWYQKRLRTPLLTIDDLILERDDYCHSFIGLCVKSDIEKRFSVGKLYYFNNGQTLTDNNRNSCVYCSIDEFNLCNKTIQMLEVKEVKREATKGEYVKVISNSSGHHFKLDEIVKYVETDINGFSKFELFDDILYMRSSDYVVLEGYKEIESIKVGDMVEVVDHTESFPSYEKWFEKNGNLKYKNNFVSNTRPIKNKHYKIVGEGKHECSELYTDTVYAIQDLDTNQVFIISEKGIKKC